MNNDRHMRWLLVVLIVVGTLLIAPAIASDPITRTLSITSPGVYTLENDILNSTAPVCIRISASDVILDGKGHTISGTGKADSRGIYLIDSTNVTIRNLTITDWDAGIYGYESDAINISQNRIQGNILGVDLLDAGGSWILENTFLENSEEAIHLENSGRNWVVSNTITNNSIGIAIWYPTLWKENTLYNNSLNNSVNSQLFAHESENNTWNSTGTPGQANASGWQSGGNYWAAPNGTGFSQTCTDADQDGICDLPYVLADGNIDFLPLTRNPFEDTLLQ